MATDCTKSTKKKRHEDDSECDRKSDENEELEDGEIISAESESLDLTAEQIRAERHLRRKLKKARKKAERQAAALINGESLKKRKKRKHSDVGHLDGEYRSPKRQVQHEDAIESRPETSKEVTTTHPVTEERTPSQPLTEEEIKRRKEEYKQRVAKSMQLPKLFLTLREVFGRSVEKEGAVVPPLEVQNIQDFVLYSLIGMKASVMPKWCRLLRWTKITSVVVVVLNSITQKHLNDSETCRNINKIFNMSVPIKPTKHSFEEEFLDVPVSKKKFKNTKDKDKLKYKDDDDIDRNRATSDEDCSDDSDDEFDFKPDRRGYLLTQEQMQTHGYPSEGDKGYTSTNYTEIIQKTSPMLSVDCEMCLTKEGHELTRVSVVDEELHVLYDTLVKPVNPIIHYLTEYSGITKEMLQPIKTRLSDVQEKLLELLPPDAILIGQSLESDLHALKMYHPHVIDTSILFLGHNQHKIGLRNLAAAYLRESIQNSKDGHDSVEDAVAAMKLVQLRIEKGPRMKNYHEVLAKKKCESFFRVLDTEGLGGSMLDTLNNVKVYKSDPVNSIPCLNDKETLRKIPGALHLGKFVWAQFHSMNTILQGSSLDDNTITDTLHRLDKRVKHVYDALPMKSLYVVCATGNRDESADNEDDTAGLGRCYMTLKLPSLVSTMDDSQN